MDVLSGGQQTLSATSSGVSRPRTSAQWGLTSFSGRVILSPRCQLSACRIKHVSGIIIKRLPSPYEGRDLLLGLRREVLCHVHKNGDAGTVDTAHFRR